MTLVSNVPIHRSARGVERKHETGSATGCGMSITGTMRRMENSTRGSANIDKEKARGDRYSQGRLKGIPDRGILVEGGTVEGGRSVVPMIWFGEVEGEEGRGSSRNVGCASCSQ